MTSVKKILEDGEVVQWEGYQNRATMVARSIFGIIVIWLIAHVMRAMGELNCEVNNVPTKCHPGNYAIWVNIFGYGAILWSFMANYVVRYYMTSKRIVIESGLVGTDFVSIYFDRILSSDVNVGVIDKIFGTGSIIIDTGKVTSSKNGVRNMYDKMLALNAPYDVYKTLQTTLRTNKEQVKAS